EGLCVEYPHEKLRGRDVIPEKSTQAIGRQTPCRPAKDAKRQRLTLHPHGRWITAPHLCRRRVMHNHTESIGNDQ
ncbi:hypothetical protein, partial [Photorhabdus viridis]|uniref:hypothetical protein n=1 Tax=Photorhabdus viridis TaxID=3163327 RepID=UPI0033071DCB